MVKALVLAGDLITLFIFWEGTSVTSFLLVAYKYKDEAARRGAFKALFLTGGIALQGGFALLLAVAGGADFAVLLKSGDALRASLLYPALLGQGLASVFGFVRTPATPCRSCTAGGWWVC